MKKAIQKRTGNLTGAEIYQSFSTHSETLVDISN